MTPAAVSSTLRIMELLDAQKGTPDYRDILKRLKLHCEGELVRVYAQSPLHLGQPAQRPTPEGAD